MTKSGNSIAFILKYIIDEITSFACFVEKILTLHTEMLDQGLICSVSLKMTT